MRGTLEKMTSIDVTGPASIRRRFVARILSLRRVQRGRAGNGKRERAADGGVDQAEIAIEDRAPRVSLEFIEGIVKPLAGVVASDMPLFRGFLFLGSSDHRPHILIGNMRTDQHGEISDGHFQTGPQAGPPRPVALASARYLRG
jgi:hypothetical protein